MSQKETQDFAASGIGLFTIFAVSLNGFLIYVILRHTKSRMGFYKYMLAFYALFELIFAIITYALKPLNYVTERTWFSYASSFIWAPIGNQLLNLYCMLYLTWIVLLDMHFIYRYLVVARPLIIESFEEKRSSIGIAVFIWLIILSICFVCPWIFCNKHPISQKFVDIMSEEYHIKNISDIAYHIIRTFVSIEIPLKRCQNDDGSISLLGWLSVIVHNVFVLISFAIILFCSFKIWRTIMVLNIINPNINLQRQLFITLLAQTAVPSLLTFTPLLGNFFYMLTGYEQVTPHLVHFFAMFAAMQKTIDPILMMLLIKEYRMAIFRMTVFRMRFRKNKTYDVSSLPSNSKLNSIKNSN